MLNIQDTGLSLRFVTLPPMRAVYNIAVSVSPEDEAMNPVFEWLESAKLTGTARMFGGNMPPMPSSGGKPYGYGMCASIPEGIAIPEHFKEMRLPGGIYAMLESTDDITASISSTGTKGMFSSRIILSVCLEVGTAFMRSPSLTNSPTFLII